MLRALLLALIMTSCATISFASTITGGSASGGSLNPPEFLPSNYVSLQESTTFGPSGTIFDLTTRVAPPTYISPPSANPADYDNEYTALKNASCSSDETTWNIFKAKLDGTGGDDFADSTLVWLPQSCHMRMYIDATKGDSAEETIPNTLDDVTFYCEDPALCSVEVVYRAGSYPTSMITDGTAGDGQIAFGEQPQKHVFEIGTGKIGTAEQDCNWDSTFTNAYVFGGRVVKLDASDCQITNAGATAWGPGDIARIQTNRITGYGQYVPTWLGRVACVKTYGTAAANDGTLYPNDPTGLCAGITEDNMIAFTDPLPMNYRPDAYYWGRATGSGGGLGLELSLIHI